MGRLDDYDHTPSSPSIGFGAFLHWLARLSMEFERPSGCGALRIHWPHAVVHAGDDRPAGFPILVS